MDPVSIIGSRVGEPLGPPRRDPPASGLDDPAGGPRGSRVRNRLGVTYPNETADADAPKFPPWPRPITGRAYRTCVVIGPWGPGSDNQPSLSDVCPGSDNHRGLIGPWGYRACCVMGPWGYRTCCLIGPQGYRTGGLWDAGVIGRAGYGTWWCLWDVGVIGPAYFVR